MITAQLTDIQTLHDRAHKNVQEGAITGGYSADHQTVLRLLNGTFAAELACFLHCRRHYFMATDLKASITIAELLKHVSQEMQRADQLAKRIMQLGGEPGFSPHDLEECSYTEHVGGKTLKNVVTESLIAERIATDSYCEIITYPGNNDPTIRRISEEILTQEEEYADDMVDILDDLTQLQSKTCPRTGVRSTDFSFRLVYPTYRLSREKLTILYEVFDITKVIN